MFVAVVVVAWFDRPRAVKAQSSRASGLISNSSQSNCWCPWCTGGGTADAVGGV